ncbi:MAG: Fe-S cluster assembly protein IscX [Anaerolineales bacterium]|nr:Fe-S cluster assembly protein IscX [Anaerolineales bacterium]MCZ2123110.1 Fe-S cluster assembly protein IscX [Anaerolineales bacterium]
MTLTWESSYGVALELRRQHPHVNLDDVSLGQIYQWTLELPDFEDDPALANDDILKSIYLEWYEEHIHGT